MDPNKEETLYRDEKDEFDLGTDTVLEHLNGFVGKSEKEEEEDERRQKFLTSAFARALRETQVQGSSIVNDKYYVLPSDKYLHNTTDLLTKANQSYLQQLGKSRAVFTP